MRSNPWLTAPLARQVAAILRRTRCGRWSRCGCGCRSAPRRSARRRPGRSLRSGPPRNSRRRRALALSIARWILSLGIDCRLGVVDRQAQARVHVGIGHAHLGRDGDFAAELGEHAAERFLSCAPLRCMMFLNLEWPAMVGLFVSLIRDAAPHTGRKRQSNRCHQPPRLL